MLSHREPGPPHGTLAFFGGRQATRWRHIERGGWLRDGRRVTQTLTDSIFMIWCWGVILNMSLCQFVNEVAVWGMAWSKRAYKIIKIIIGQFQFNCIHHQYTWVITTTMDCFVSRVLKLVTCYQLLNKAMMYRSVNILWFVYDLLASFAVDFITQNNLTPTCTMHLAWCACNYSNLILLSDTSCDYKT